MAFYEFYGSQSNIYAEAKSILCENKNLMRQVNYVINRCYREANKVADKLVNMGVTYKQSSFFIT